MKHSFNVDVASFVGIQSAVLFENICFWIEVNERNNRNIHNGKAWTFSSVRSYAELFPYLTERQIRYSLDKLVSTGLIETGNYNKTKYDKTKWYSLTEKGKSFCDNCANDLTKMANGKANNVKPIPNKKTNLGYIKEDEQDFSVDPFKL